MLLALWQRLRNIDWLLFMPLFVLLVLSLIVIYSISINPIAPDQTLFRKQVVFAILGIIVFFVLSNTNYRLWMTYSKFLYVLCFLVLAYVLWFGLTIRGTTGWIDLGLISFQPVEFAKVGLIVFLARYFSEHGRLFFMWHHTVTSGLAVLVYTLLVLRQPDLGSAIVLIGVWFLMLMVVGIPRKHLVTLLVMFAVVGVISWFFVLEPYQKDRIVIFFNPQADMLGVGYNVRQSIIAVGSGQIFGRGFALGSQSQLRFLPEPETDFIFAVLAEELGLIGVLVLFAGFFFILYRLIIISRKTMDNFAAFFCLGLASLFVLQSFINIGMNIGIAPVTGIPLPLMSVGGSSLLAFCIALGIASSIVADQRTLTAE